MRFAPLRRAAVMAALALTGACSNPELGPNPVPVDTPCPADDGGGVPLLGTDCDPLVPTQCGFPFPSNVYLADDPFTASGKRVTFGRTTLPGYTPKTHLEPFWFQDMDGFSPGATLLTHIVGAVADGLPTQDDLERSLAGDSPTVLIEADTGVRVPHFAEIDESLIDQEQEDKAFLIRPVVRLKDATRYIVAIRHVVDGSGKVIAPTPTWKALRDGGDSCDPAVTRRRALYADIFDKLDKAGVPKDDLQIAWDFSTASRENNTARMLRMRDDALGKVGSTGPTYTIASIEENPNPHIRRRLHVMMHVPSYMNSPDPGARMVVDAQGMPMQNGYADYEVLVHIPNSAVDPDKPPAALLQNGHGLLGYKDEGQDGYLAELADKWNYVAFAVDLIGMAHDDFPIIASSATTDIEGFVGAVERQHQGVINSLLAMRMMMGGFANDPATIIDGKHTIDPTLRFYRGDSQGGIFGTTYMSVSTDVTRGLLGEPGLPYSLLLNRSEDFGTYLVLLRGSFRTGRNLQLAIGVIQMLWDRTEPNGYVPYLAGGDLPGTPAHDVLLHVAIGDHQVTPLGAHIIARTVGAKNLTPVNRSVWGIDDAAGPFTGSGMVEFDFGNKTSPVTNIPPNDTYGPDPHDEVRKLPEAMDQTNEFFRNGDVKPFCQGSCNPE